MPNQDPIPSSNQAFDALQLAIMNAVTANAMLWNIPASEIALLTAAQTKWNTTWQATKSRNNSTTVQRTARNVARKKYEKLLRPFIQRFIQRNTAMTAADIVKCGLKPRDLVRTSLPVPETIPNIRHDVMYAHRLKIYFRQATDADGSTRRGKPKGIIFCELCWAVGGTPPENAEACTQRVNASRSPFVLTFTEQQAGQRVYLFARWINAKGEPGMWSECHRMMVP